jgi:hypothetical protein
MENDRYKAAKAWAKAEMADSAFFNLEKIVIRLGYSDYEKITNENDFKSLHNDNRWLSLIDQVKKNKLPSGWRRWGNQLTSYQMYLDSGMGQDGKSALCIKSIDPEVDGYGTIMQQFLADNYQGKRIRMSAYLKTSNVNGWAGLWMRVNDEKSTHSLSFDNMQDRSVKGTTDWKKYEIVLDVPSNAYKISFGALLSGTGQIWFENFSFAEVAKDTPVTGTLKSTPNLDFDK